MKRRFLSLVITVVFFMTMCNTLSENDLHPKDYNYYSLIVKISDTNSDEDFVLKTKNIRNSKIRRILRKYNVRELPAVFINRYDEYGKLKPGHEYSDKISCYRRFSMNDRAKITALANLLSYLEGVTETYVVKPIQIKPSISPNDTYYENQWHLNSTINPLSDIEAEQAWDINKGRNDVIIAVCDGGVDYNHSDLDPGDRSRVIAGFDFGDLDSDPMDDLPDDHTLSFAGHGTHIAGIIGAITNNDNDVAGIMWNCKIMPVKMVGSQDIKWPFVGTIWDFSTTAFPWDVANAIDYAVNNGANVINLSYGFNDCGVPLNQVIFFVPTLYNALSNAYENNVVVVAAMGNEYKDGNPTEYPAAFSHEVIAVGSTNQALQRSETSNTGPHIDLSAPGSSILSTWRGNNTRYASGTSMATPIVSGVSGLIISQAKDRNFQITNDDVRHILQITSDDILAVGFDEESGYGKVNAYNALALLDEPNIMYHGNEFSGSSAKQTTLDQWIYVGGPRWGLSSGSYYQVDRYIITKHVDFDIPFCSTPNIWLRERESISLSFANPNDGFPWAEITNITPTGFDVEYAAYFVRYDFLAREINKWVPSHPSTTKIEYSAVGEPNLAATSGQISGPSLLCSSEEYEVDDLPPNAQVNWSVNPSSGIVTLNQSDNTATLNRVSNGVVTLTATILAGCGNATRNTSIVVGIPSVNPSTIQFECSEGLGYLCNNSFGNEFSFTYNYPYNHFDIKLTNISETQTYTQFTTYNTFGTLDCFLPEGTYLFHVRPNNDCGTATNWSKTSVEYVDCGMGGLFSLDIYPNPSTEQATITIVTKEEMNTVTNKVDKEWQLEVYTQGQLPKLNIPAIFDNKYILNTSGWKAGVYFIRVYYKDEVLWGTLIVNK